MPRAGWVDARMRTPLWLEDAGDLYWYRALPESGTLYCQVNAIQQDPADSLKTFMARAIASVGHARSFCRGRRRRGSTLVPGARPEARSPSSAD